LFASDSTPPAARVLAARHNSSVFDFRTE